MSPNTNKILGAIVAIAIIISVAILIYVNLPKQADTSPEENIPPVTNPIIFTIRYDDQQINYTMAGIERLEPYTAKGGYRKQSGSFAGQGNYTGVNISTLINTLQSPPLQYSLKVFSDDGEYITYNLTTIHGNVHIYNPDNASDPDPIGIGNMTMVLAYYFEGNWLDESSDGKLKIVFLDEQGSITKSSLWWKKVTSILVQTE